MHMCEELVVLATASIWAWPSFFVKRGTKCLITRKVTKCEWSPNFGEALEKLGSRFSATAGEKIEISI